MNHSIRFFVRCVLRSLCPALAACAGALAGSVPADGAEHFPQPVGWPHIVTARVWRQTIGPGVTYEQWHLATSAGPLAIHVARVAPFNPYVGFRVATAHGVVSGPGETLSSMAARLHAELGINADYFDINGTGSPENVVIADGRVLHSPDASVACVVTRSGRLSMQRVGFDLRIDTPHGSLDVPAVNDWAPPVERFLVTPQAARGPVATGPATVAWLADVGGAENFVVTRLGRAVTRIGPLGWRERALVARGPSAQSLTALMHPGERVRLQGSLQPRLGDPVEQAVGGGPAVLIDGRVVETPAPPAPQETYVHNPVTGLGISRDGSRAWLVVVDGRNPTRSIGLTRPELGELFLALGAQSAMAFDSGGSSEMVVRPLGELWAGVANHPSDGRERPIADALFVVNTAPYGPVRSIIVSAHPAAVGPRRFDDARSVHGMLVGSSVRLTATGLDDHGHPVALAPDDVHFVLASPAGRLRERDVVTGLRPGRITVHAFAAGAQGTTTLNVVGSVSRLVLHAADHVPVGAREVVRVSAADAAGRPLAVDPGAISWTAQGGATIFVGGLLIAGAQPGRYVVSARVGGAVGRMVVLAGEHVRTMQTVPTASGDGGAWQLACEPGDACGTLDSQAAPDGAAALHMGFALNRFVDRTRAAVASTALPVDGRPTALLIDVYGDGSGVWLRAGYRTTLGVRESLTLARHVSWIGWRQLRVDISDQSAWPLTLTALYVVAPPHAGPARGDVWFRNLRFAYPGPEE